MPNYFSPFSLRVSEEMIGKIKIIAAKNHRSANKEIEAALEQHIAAYEQKHGPIEVKKEEP